MYDNAGFGNHCRVLPDAFSVHLHDRFVEGEFIHAIYTDRNAEVEGFLRNGVSLPIFLKKSFKF